MPNPAPARPTSPFHFLPVDPFDQGVLIAEAMIARRDSSILQAVGPAMKLCTEESAGFLSAIRERLVGHA